ncbi:hypothetical protein BX661DRAFT_170337 [Kickxella alabastrina]|uniref:uncharacterized protein n=1 Tax=Kickxella alabastrina TaxID=61397 RepID=UPI00222105CE|nr:uncharacterized protein BX661DRAFT_170337 [Kickxella alabastrina]KAI7829980.1 hypothetical protein BX661DRAFT_170337 [Kickxella alabastrina]
MLVFVALDQQMLHHVAVGKAYQCDVVLRLAVAHMQPALVVEAQGSTEWLLKQLIVGAASVAGWPLCAAGKGPLAFPTPCAKYVDCFEWGLALLLFMNDTRPVLWNGGILLGWLVRESVDLLLVFAFTAIIPSTLPRLLRAKNANLSLSSRWPRGLPVNVGVLNNNIECVAMTRYREC